MPDLIGVDALTIPEGSVQRITANGIVIWEKHTGLIPSAYQQVEYIGMDGSSGIVYSEPYAAVCEIVQNVAFTEWYGFYWSGSYLNVTTPLVALRVSRSAQRSECHGGDSTAIYCTTQTLDTVYTYSAIADYDSLQMSYNVTQGDTPFYSATKTIPSVSSINIRSFGIGCNGCLALNEFNSVNGSGAFSSAQCLRGKVYSYQHRSNGIVVRDFIPCYRKSDGVIGMYDVVSNTFFTNAGTGTFTKGADVSE